MIYSESMSKLNPVHIYSITYIFGIISHRLWLASQGLLKNDGGFPRKMGEFGSWDSEAPKTGATVATSGTCSNEPMAYWFHEPRHITSKLN